MSEELAQRPAVVILGEDNTITLPDDIARRFHPDDRFVLLPQGDMLILKRLPPRVSEIVATAPEEASPLSLDEISDIVHEIRAQHRRE